MPPPHSVADDCNFVLDEETVRYVMKLGRRFYADREAARDLAMDTVRVYLERKPSFPNVSAKRSWFSDVMRKVSAGRRRTDTRRSQRIKILQEARVTDALQVEHVVIRDALACLSLIERVVFLGRALEGKTIEDLSVELGFGLNVIKRLDNESRKKLRSYLEQQSNKGEI